MRGVQGGTELTLLDGEQRNHPLELAFANGAFEYLPVGALCLFGAAVTAVNAEWRAISGLSSAQSEGVGWWQALHADDHGRLLACIERCDEVGDVDVRLDRAELRWVRFRVRAVDHAQLNVATVTVLGQHRSNDVRLLHLSRHDGLTGLSNRAEFIGRIRHHLFAGRAMSGLLYIDLDQFKVVNDRLGHRCGDELLIAVSRRIEATIRHSDHAGRLGGDQLAVFCPGIGSTDEVLALADRLVRALGTPFSIDGHIVIIDASIGVSFTDHVAEPAADLIDRADRAMYAAKAAGGGRWATLDAELANAPILDHRVAAVAAAFAHDVARAESVGIVAEQLEGSMRDSSEDAHQAGDR